MATGQVNRSAAELSSQIFFYTHRRSNNVIYSLTRTLNNTKARKQLPFLGKKSVPAAIRKDEWSPFATVQFASPHQCREAFRQLQEYRQRHLLEWPLELRKDKDGKKVDKRELGARIGDQRANSVADLAAVLSHHEKIADRHQETLRARREKEEGYVTRSPQVKAELKAEKEAMGTGPITQKYKDLKREKIFLRKQLQRMEEAAAAGRTDHIVKSKGRKQEISWLPAFSADDVEIEWADPQNASWAESWPENVTHTAKLMERRLNIGDSLAEMARLDDEAAALQQNVDVAKARVERLVAEATRNPLEPEFDGAADEQGSPKAAQLREAEEQLKYRELLLRESLDDLSKMRTSFRHNVFSLKSYSARVEPVEADEEDGIDLGSTGTEAGAQTTTL